jgi:hypothetical protein
MRSKAGRIITIRVHTTLPYGEELHRDSHGTHAPGEHDQGACMYHTSTASALELTFPTR